MGSSLRGLRSAALALWCSAVAVSQSSSPAAAAARMPPAETACGDRLPNRTLCAFAKAPATGADGTIVSGLPGAGGLMTPLVAYIVRVQRKRTGTATNILSFAEVEATSDAGASLLSLSSGSSSSPSTSGANKALDRDTRTSFVSADADLAWAEFVLGTSTPSAIPVSTLALLPANDATLLAGAELQLLTANRDLVASWPMPALSANTRVYFYASQTCLDVQQAFDAFAARSSRTYATVEERRLRLSIFNETAARVLRHNSRGNESYTLGINFMADLSPAEIQTRWLGLINPPPGTSDSAVRRLGDSGGSSLRGLSVASPMPAAHGRVVEAGVTGHFEARHLQSIPAAVDWSADASKVVPVKNQASCGSCYAFSVMHSIETGAALNGYPLTPLAEQQLVDCSIAPATSLNAGCNGGVLSMSFNWLTLIGGACTASSYPYTAAVGTCNQACTKAVLVDGFSYVQSNNDTAIMMAIAAYGSVSTSMQITAGFINYAGGVFQDSSCDGSTNHAINIVGYGVDAATGLPFWKVRNSWGTGWGLGGYIKVRRGNINVCGLLNYLYQPRIVRPGATPTRSASITKSPASATTTPSPSWTRGLSVSNTKTPTATATKTATASLTRGVSASQTASASPTRSQASLSPTRTPGSASSTRTPYTQTPTPSPQYFPGQQLELSFSVGLTTTSWVLSSFVNGASVSVAGPGAYAITQRSFGLSIRKSIRSSLLAQQPFLGPQISLANIHITSATSIGDSGAWTGAPFYATPDMSVNCDDNVTVSAPGAGAGWSYACADPRNVNPTPTVEAQPPSVTTFGAAITIKLKFSFCYTYPNDPACSPATTATATAAASKAPMDGARPLPARRIQAVGSRRPDPERLAAYINTFLNASAALRTVLRQHAAAVAADPSGAGSPLLVALAPALADLRAADPNAEPLLLASADAGGAALSGEPLAFSMDDGFSMSVPQSTLEAAAAAAAADAAAAAAAPSPAAASDGLSSGALAGIIAGAVVAVALLVGGVAIARNRSASRAHARVPAPAPSANNLSAASEPAMLTTNPYANPPPSVRAHPRRSGTAAAADHSDSPRAVPLSARGSLSGFGGANSPSDSRALVASASRPSMAMLAGGYRAGAIRTSGGSGQTAGKPRRSVSGSGKRASLAATGVGV